MSWDDVVIGDGEKLSSAAHISGLTGSVRVSQNRSAYWVSDAYLGLGMTVYKDTPEGKELARMIQNAKGEPADSVQTQRVEFYIADLVLTHAKGSTVQRAIDDAINDAYRRGGEDRAKRIRDSLGVTELLRY